MSNSTKSKEPEFSDEGLVSAEREKQIFEGWLTYSSIGVIVISLIVRALGGSFPEAEVNHFTDYVNGSLPMLIEGFAAIMAIFGRARVNWREPEVVVLEVPVEKPVETEEK